MLSQQLNHLHMVSLQQAMAMLCMAIPTYLTSTAACRAVLPLPMLAILGSAPATSSPATSSSLPCPADPTSRSARSPGVCPRWAPHRDRVWGLVRGYFLFCLCYTILTLTIGRWPALTAARSGVSLLLSLTCTLAPLSSNHLTRSCCPLEAATWRAVRPL